ncbi:MAG: PBP superfamily domain protein [Methanosaeta sp. PtaB.Bin039]|nr:MAG: PBP superfamily domain protein [Methanosaeta sp. PtaB.Bin039]HOT07666.1 substrate-binding domain-containing protein [Methanotrichaceae archaeon]HQF15914.1 substrate-binding domain-containing protein [Methanotrichaceae archaeon]HQI90738.1 substrate-binding domain-containing protein [Methanotrichaceae archaeon]HQJ27984.1 substrate-binding domain-containing protein [Methanotrichaceae archaeon]
MRTTIATLLAVLLCLPMAIAADDSADSGSRLKIATTTSLYDTKLLDLLEDKFEEEYGIELDIVSGGTGIAIQYGEKGDVDMLMVHDKAREIKFIEDGYGLYRRCFAYNYFYVIGPSDDPANIKGMNASSALKTIMEMGMQDPAKSKFVSRGDNSGTHSKEKSLWRAAGVDSATINATGDWYVEAGQGMGATLMMAEEKQAYTLTDMSTFMAYRGNMTLMPLIEGSEDLLNVYAAIPISPVKHPNVNCAAAQTFIDFLVSAEGQEMIATYGEDKYGQPLFMSALGQCDVMGCNETECATPAAACPAPA